MKHKINIKKSPLDIRDYQAVHFIDNSIELPESYISPKTKVRCQWLSSQCVAYACTQAMSQQESINGNYNLYSPHYIYETRENKDDGWYVRACLKNLQKIGTTLNHSNEVYKIKSYFRCNSIDEIKRCIMQHGCVISSCDVHGSDWFLKSKINIDQKKKELICGHAFIIVGWKDDYWIVQDSYSIFRPFLGKFKLDMLYPLDEF